MSNTIEQACLGKKAFAVKKTIKRRLAGNFKLYRCPYCRAWHITKKRKKV